MTAHNGAPRRESAAAIAALAAGSTVSDASRQSGIPRRTLVRWSKSPKFQTKVDEARGEIVRQAVGVLVDSATAAARALAEIAQDDANPAAARVAACRALLDGALRWREAAEFEARLTALEAEREEASHATF